jgi:hypothetical protein
MASNLAIRVAVWVKSLRSVFASESLPESPEPRPPVQRATSMLDFLLRAERLPAGVGEPPGPSPSILSALLASEDLPYSEPLKPHFRSRSLVKALFSAEELPRDESPAPPARHRWIHWFFAPERLDGRASETR